MGPKKVVKQQRLLIGTEDKNGTKREAGQVTGERGLFTERNAYGKKCINRTLGKTC